MKFKISLAIALAILSSSANAAVITRTGSNISFDGDMGKEYKNTEVQLQILGPFDEQKSLEESIFVTSSTSPVFMDKTYINTVSADNDGKYTFSYSATTENKYYTVMVNEPDKTKVQHLSLYVPSAALETEFLAAVNSATSAASMQSVFENPSYIDILKGNRSDFLKITDAESKTKLAAEMAKGIPYADISDFENNLTLICAVLLTNTLTDAAEARELAENKINISSSPLYSIYNSFSNEIKSAVFSRMIGKNFSSLAEYMTKFNESVFLEKVKSEIYASNLTALIKSNAELFGFNLANYSGYENAVNAKLYGKDYSDISSFKIDLLGAISDALSSSSLNPPVTPVGGGGGGGGGGSIPTGALLTIIENGGSGGFSDIANVAWAQNAINNLAKTGVVSGKGDGKFAPMDNIKREEFVQMIVKAFNLYGIDTDLDFEDVKENEWYFGSIKTAYSLGIINGMDGSTFGVGRFITREDMAAIILRTAKKLGKSFGDYSEGTVSFVDDAEIAGYAKEAVYALRNSNIIAGMDGNRFEPKSNATRAQAAVIIYALTENLN